jgi:hypothetical protein
VPRTSAATSLADCYGCCLALLCQLIQVQRLTPPLVLLLLAWCSTIAAARLLLLLLVNVRCLPLGKRSKC